MTKKLVKIAIIFIFGTAGGIFADQILWPYFVERPLFYQYRLEQSPIYVQERSEIIIQENIALQDAVEKVGNSLVEIKTSAASGEVLKGSGVIITSDGLALAPANIVPQGVSLVFSAGGKPVGYQILKRDSSRNLVLVKTDKSDLPAVGFADFGRIKLGERIFLLGLSQGKSGSQKIVNEGIVKTFDDNLIQTSILEKSGLQNAPLFNIKGELVGLAGVDKEGRVSAVSIKQIREFTGF